jgi:mycothiol S-conjugate amidase
VVAFDAAGDPERFPEEGEPWQPFKLYYHHTFTKAKFTALHEGMIAAGLDSPYSEMIERWEDDGRDKGYRITTRVECASYFQARDDALRAHATQVDPDGFWFRAPLEVQQRVWPTEDYELVRSVLDSTLPEDDLFTGVRDSVGAR